ncbi:MAG: protein-tyrosine phosphatase [Cocleimonas sp.]|jgi:protein-tyrosine phosphatase
MEQRYAEAIKNKFPVFCGKVHLIGKWNNNEEIPGPFKKLWY